MDNLVNSLVGQTVGLTANQMQAATANTLKDYQGKTYNPDTILALSKQIAASIDPNAVKGGVYSTKGKSVGFDYDESTKLLGHPPTATEQVFLDMARHLANEGVTDLNKVDATDTNRRFGSTFTGGGGTIYEIKKDASGKPIISSWSKDTSDKKAILTGLAVAAAAFGIPGVTEGLLNGAPAGATLGSVATEAAGGSSLSSLASLAADADIAGGLIPEFGTNAAANSFMAGAMTPEAIASLGATVAAAPEIIGSGNALTTAAAGTNLANAAKTLIDPTTGLALKAAGDLTSSVANQSGINNARDAITQGGATANTALNTAYNDARNLNTAGRTDLANNYANLNTNLNNTLNGQSGIYNATNTSLGNNYANLNTNLNNTINAQVGAYDAANQGIKANAATQLGLLGSTYQGQKDQAAANAAALNANYGNARGDLYDIYNKQVGFQQPYQDVGRAGSQGLINNQDYLTRQFTNADLNANLAPNYAFQLAQGQMANQRAANMGGGSMGGNAMRGLQDYTQNYAAGAYQNAFNNFQGQRTNIYNTLRGMADIGTTSGGQLASLGNTLGGNLGSLSSNLGSNLTTNAGNLLNAGNVYGSNTSGVTNNLNNVLSSNLGQLQSAYGQYGSNLTSGSNTYAGNMVNNANTMQGAYNNYGNNLTTGATNYENNLTANTNTGVNAANVYGLNSANLATGIAGALASNSTATGANNATALSNLGNTALLGSMIKAT